MSRRRNTAAVNGEHCSTSSYTGCRNYGDGKSETDGSTDYQFLPPPRKFPWKPIALILSFMSAGIVCLCLGILITTGYYDEKYEDRVWPLLMLGILMFIPGGYYGYILLCICLKRDGFTLDDIPIF